MIKGGGVYAEPWHLILFFFFVMALIIGLLAPLTRLNLEQAPGRCSPCQCQSHYPPSFGPGPTNFTTICPAFTPGADGNMRCSFCHQFSQCRYTPKMAPPSSCATIFSLGTDMPHSLLYVFLTDSWIFVIEPFFSFSVLRNADLCNMSSDSEF